MYGYIYITTNLLNGKKYIGKHKSSEFEFDKYYCSGKYIKAAIKKYGLENFKCELLESINNIPTICNSEDELNASENYYTLFYDCVNSSEYYNLIEGGTGGAQVYQSLSAEEKRVRNLKISKSSIKYWDNVSEESSKVKSEKWRKSYFDKSDEEIRARNQHNSVVHLELAKNRTIEEIESRKIKLKESAQKRLNNPETERIRKEKEKVTKNSKSNEEKLEYKKKQREAHLGVHEYTDGIRRIRCKPENVPAGFYRCNGHKNNSKYICIIDDKEFLGLKSAATYLKSIGFNSITRDKVLLLAKNESRLLTKRFANLEGRIKVLDKVMREILWEN